MKKAAKRLTELLHENAFVRARIYYTQYEIRLKWKKTQTTYTWYFIITMVYGVLESSSAEAHVGNYYYYEYTTIHAREAITLWLQERAQKKKRKKPTHFFTLTRYVRLWLRIMKLTSGISYEKIWTRFVDRPLLNAARENTENYSFDYFFEFSLITRKSNGKYPVLRMPSWTM